jgi:hypothetical protein
MKNCLLLCVAVLALAVAQPASAQYMFLDVNGDGFCDTGDVIDNTTTSVDVWLATSYDANFFPVTCPTGQELTINSYTFILRSTGGLSYGAWTDNMGFGTNLGTGVAGNDRWVGRGSGTILPADIYKLGTQAITVTGSPVLSIVSSTSASAQALTSFGSSCLGVLGNNTMKLGLDWFDVCGTSSSTPVTDTTWGKIKALYRGN